MGWWGSRDLVPMTLGQWILAPDMLSGIPCVCVVVNLYRADDLLSNAALHSAAEDTSMSSPKSADNNLPPYGRHQILFE